MIDTTAGGVHQLRSSISVHGSNKKMTRVAHQLSHLTNAAAEVTALVAGHPDATLMELCELFALSYRKLGESGSNVSLCDKN
jgi:hypothetical protein